MHFLHAPAPRSLRTSTRPAAAPGPAPLPNLRCWAKFTPTPTVPYLGEYGFDWIDWKRDPLPQHLQDELTKVIGTDIKEYTYCYDAHQTQYLPVAKDAHLKQKLQDEYQRVLVYGEDYYAGWLSMRLGQEIKLQLRIEALNQHAAQNDYLTFGAHADYRVTANGQVNEAIRIKLTAGSTAANPQLQEISIRCQKVSAATALLVLDEEKTVVGRLNVVDNTKTVHLPIRLVYLVKDGPSSAAALGKLQATVAALNLTNYLNTNSLNQAQIKVAFEQTNQVHTLVFKQAEWAGKLYDIANNWLTNNVAKTKLGATTFLIDKVLAEYVAKYEKPGSTPFRGILLLVTNIKQNPADNQGGVSRVRPVSFREAFILGTNIDDQTTYSHEIGHALGLDHTFLNADSNGDAKYHHDMVAYLQKYIKTCESSCTYYQQAIASQEAALALQKADFKRNAAFYAQHPQTVSYVKVQEQKLVASLEADKKAAAANQQSLKWAERELAEHQSDMKTFAANPYKFKKGLTLNSMDYNSSTGVAFYHWKWQVMQNDVRTYYGSVK